MKKVITFLAFILMTASVFSQKKVTSSATVTFDATTAKDAMPKAENKTVIGSLNTVTGDIAFEAPVKNFTFGNPKMQEHFNGPQWFNSDTYPVVSFTGKIEKMKDVNFKKDGVYKVKVSGFLKIRDISHEQKMEATITVSGGKINASSDFTVKLEDYKIAGAPVDAGKIAKEPKVSVNADF